MESFDTLTSNLAEFTKQGISGMTDLEAKEYRKKILTLSKQCKTALSDTSTKNHDYDETEVSLYVQRVLEDGYNLQPTKLSSNESLIDAQHLTWWKELIKGCVQNSQFGETKFKIEALSYQRSAIENASTLHELRQAIRAMIGPLSMYREYNAPVELEYTLCTEEQLILENEQLNLELKEKTRMLSEITKLYDEPLKVRKGKIDLVASVEAYKEEHHCSDDDACSFFDISRSTLKRARKELTDMA